MKHAKTIAGIASILLASATAFADEPFALYDANGIRVGRFDYDSVQLTVTGQPYMVRMQGDRHSMSTLDYEATTIYFESQDCTGRKLAFHGRPYGAPSAIARVDPSGRVVLLPFGKRWKTTYVYSYLPKDRKCHGFGIPSDLAVAELGDPIDITTLYTRPFTVR